MGQDPVASGGHLVGSEEAVVVVILHDCIWCQLTLSFFGLFREAIVYNLFLVPLYANIQCFSENSIHRIWFIIWANE